MFGGGFPTVGKRKVILSRTQATKDYFDEDEDDTNTSIPVFNDHFDPLNDDNKLDHEMKEVIPIPKELTSDDVDPLDLFMLDVEKDVANNINKQHTEYEIVSYSEEKDDYNDYNGVAGSVGTNNLNENTLNNDEKHDIHDNTNKKLRIEPLAAVDHSTIHYKPFEKCFYKPHLEVEALPWSGISQLRREFDMNVTSSDPHISTICPVSKFEHMGK